MGDPAGRHAGEEVKISSEARLPAPPSRTLYNVVLYSLHGLHIRSLPVDAPSFRECAWPSLEKAPCSRSPEMAGRWTRGVQKVVAMHISACGHRCLGKPWRA